MKHILTAIIVGVITSFYLFPFKFTFFPLMNTKMMVAGLGVLFFVVDMLRKKDLKINKDLFTLFFLAALFSLVCLVSVIINNTEDYEYVTYIASMGLWLSGAYGVCSFIMIFHQKVNVRIICNYVIGVCVFQCLIAILMDNNIAIRNIVDLFIFQSADFLKSINRLYGIGASLDVAGTRFAACIIFIIYFLASRSKELSKSELWFYLISLFIVFVFGNMIARTTTIGMIVGLIWFLLVYFYRNIWTAGDIKPGRVMARLSLVVAIAIPLCVNIYNTDVKMHKLFRFAFEGFFSLIEDGRWQVDSNDRLETMIVLPDNTKTWIIGDGYMTNPSYKDNYYIGRITEGNFYMATDIGYLRFIFYCGLVGLLFFMAFFYQSWRLCKNNDPIHKWLFMLLLLLNYIIWTKVATDIFVIIALMVCAVYLQKESSAESDVNEVLEASLN